MQPGGTGGSLLEVFVLVTRRGHHSTNDCTISNGEGSQVRPQCSVESVNICVRLESIL